jgi:hypothetical protein
MKLEVYRYSSVRPTVAHFIKSNPEMTIADLCSKLAVATHVPALAICYFIEEVKGASEELERQKNTLINFYKYTNIVLENLEK